MTRACRRRLPGHATTHRPHHAVNPQGTVCVIPATAGLKVYDQSAKMSAECFDLFVDQFGILKE